MFTTMDLVNYMKANFVDKFYPIEFPSQEKGNCSILLFNSGGRIDRNIGTPSFQILVRAKHPADAETMANKYFAFYNQKTNFQIGTTHIIQCVSASAVPIYTGQQDEWYIYSLNFNMIISK